MDFTLILKNKKTVRKGYHQNNKRAHDVGAQGKYKNLNISIPANKEAGIFVTSNNGVEPLF